MIKNLTKKMLVSAILVSSVAGVVISQDNKIEAAEQTNSKNQIGSFEKINQSEAIITFEKNYSFNIDKTGVATVTNNTTGSKEVLPTFTKDKNGKPVTLNYLVEGNSLKMLVVDNSNIQFTGWKEALKCGLGTVGGIGGGGLAGAGVGSAVPVIGTTAGAIIGGVSGGMTGAAASCF